MKIKNSIDRFSNLSIIPEERIVNRKKGQKKISRKKCVKNATMEKSRKRQDKEDMMRKSSICIIGVLDGKESKNGQKQCLMR